MWWKPWTWRRVVQSVTVSEAEWSTRDRYLLLALARLERDTNAVGIPLDVATDPANQFRFISKPTTDFALRTLAEDQARFNEKADKANDGKPVSRAGQMWSVRLKDEDN